MQKALLKFLVFELIERVARFRLLTQAAKEELSLQVPALYQALLREASNLEAFVLEQRSTLNRLFNDSPLHGQGLATNPRTQRDEAVPELLREVYTRLCPPSRLLAHLKNLQVEPETHLFLKDALAGVFSHSKPVGELSVFLVPEGETKPFSGLSANLSAPAILLQPLSILQKSNPLGWLVLCGSAVDSLIASSGVLENLKQELSRIRQKKSGAPSSSLRLPQSTEETMTEELFRHAIHLRLIGPAYYFEVLSQTLLTGGTGLLKTLEPALFFGLNHQNFVHKSLVILHEACERSKVSESESVSFCSSVWSEEALAVIYRAAEKLIPAKWAFNEKQLNRAVQLRDRLGEGILISSSARYDLGEVSDKLRQTGLGSSSNDGPDSLANVSIGSSLPIYEPLSMMTEYPHSPREIVNAGWLHKIDRGPIWLYSLLNEEPEVGFERLCALLQEQDTLLRKSIEVSQIHRVLLGSA
jgi:hypothetical protein